MGLSDGEIYQAGEAYIGTENLSSSAYYLAAKLGYKLDKHVFSIGYDVMSGDDDASDDSFSTYMNNYTFAHAYFGWMDKLVPSTRLELVIASHYTKVGNSHRP